MDDEILQILRENPREYLSGEAIRRTLKVSRTAVWKRVKRLRASGYEIEASRRLGYRLTRSPDLLTASELKPLLKTRWMGKVIHYFRTIDSTNGEAYRLALNGASEGEIVIAESQEKGRGRLGRHWVSPPFVNLYLSVILQPPIAPSQASLMTLMAAVAVTEGIEAYSGLQAIIKWPNDILLKNRKVAGLLNEIHSEMDRIHFVILGIGVNLNMEGAMFPKEIRSAATSLKQETGQPVSRKEVVQCVLSALEKWYDTFLKEGGDRILEAWKDRAQIKGKPVRVTSFGETLMGRAVDIDSEGRLIIETKGGEQKRVVAGDIEYVKRVNGQ